MKEIDVDRLSGESLEEAETAQETGANHSDWQFEGKSARVLFVCKNNSARSQMAEALTNHLSHGQVEAFSAGSHPAAQIHPFAVSAIARLGADMSKHVPKSLEQFHGQVFDRVIILYDRESEDKPTVESPGATYWNTPAPVKVKGNEQEQQRAFNLLAMELTTRIRLLLTLLEREKRAGVS